jgi:hypothetical protein
MEKKKSGNFKRSIGKGISDNRNQSIERNKSGFYSDDEIFENYRFIPKT